MENNPFDLLHTPHASRLTFHISRHFLTGSSPDSYDAFINHDQEPSTL